MIAEVIVDVATSETDRIYDYLCPAHVRVGSRVLAPFGKKTVPGFIVRLKDKSELDEKRLKEVSPLDGDIPALNAECLSLAKKIAARYRVPLALSLRLFLPAEMRTGKVRELYKTYVELVEGFDLSKIRSGAKNQKAAAEYLLQNGKTERSFLNVSFPGAVKAFLE